MKNNIRKIASLLVMVLAICALTVTATAAIADAKTVAYDQVYYDSITSSDSDDYYKFTLGSYSKVTVGITTTMRPYTLTIYDVNEKEVWTKTVKKGLFETVTDDSAFYQKELDAGTYYLKVSSTSTGSYNLKLTYVLATKSVADVDNDNNNSIVTAKNIALGSTTSGKLYNEGERDFYKFTVTSAGSLDYKMLSKMRYYSAVLYNDVGTELWKTEKNEWDSSAKQREDTHKLELSAGTYYLEINGNEASKGSLFIKPAVATGTYQFALNFKSADTNEVEVNNSVVEAKKVSLVKTYRGHLSITDSKDVFEFTVAKGDLAIGFVSSMPTYNITVYDETGASKWSSKNNAKDEKAASRSDLHRLSLDAGKYYIAISGSTGKYSFKLDQNINLSKVTSLRYSRSVTYVTLKWTKAANANGYVVYKYDDAKEDYVKIGSTTKTYLKIKNLNGGTDYKFMVKAYRKVNGLYIYGDEAEILTRTTPSKAKFKSVKAGATGSKLVTVTWNKVTGADGYRIYYSVDSDFETVKTVTVKPGDKTSTVIKNLRKGKKYYFRVRAFEKVNGKNVWGKYSNVASVRVK